MKGTPEKVFDALALPPVTAMMRLIYAAMLAGLDRDGNETPEGVRPEDVDLYDIPRHMRAALSPLIAWAGKSSTHKYLARELGRPVEEIAIVLEQVRDAWGPARRHELVRAAGDHHPEHPNAGPRAPRGAAPTTTTASDAPDRARSPGRARRPAAAVLRALPARGAARAALGPVAVGLRGPGRADPAEDIASTWFWRAWQRILDESEQDAGGTTGGR